MRVTFYLSWLLAVSGLSSAANSSCALTSGDTSLLEYTWALSNFLSSFYASVPVNSSLASSISNSTSASTALANLKGIEASNNLTVEAVRELSSKAPGFRKPQCQYTYPSVNSVSSFAKYAYQFESTLCGAFIGAAGYTQSPEVAFLLARLAAEHSAHSTWIGSRVNSTMFSNATSLVSAFTPAQVLRSSNSTGSLGLYLHDCVQAPKEPCGKLKIGPLEANLTSSSAGAGGASSTPLGSSTPVSSSASATGSSHRH